MVLIVSTYSYHVNKIVDIYAYENLVMSFRVCGYELASKYIGFLVICYYCLCECMSYIKFSLLDLLFPVQFKFSTCFSVCIETRVHI